MSLGLLAKDSIQDLQAYNQEDESKPPPMEKRFSLDRIEDQIKSIQRPQVKQNDTVVKPPSKTLNKQPSKDSETSTQEKKKTNLQYQGFQNDYYHPENYDLHASYAAPILSKRQQEAPSFQTLLVCLFPWLKLHDEMEHPVEEEINDTSDNNREETDMNNNNNTERSNGSSDSTYGEKLSEKERQAVVARLRLAQPEESPRQQLKEASSNQRSSAILEELPEQKPLKSIMKRGSVANIEEKSLLDKEEKDGQPRRRSLFPTYEITSKSLNVDFAPMARVVTVKSRNDMTDEERGDIWWQRSDYEDFRKTGRIITKAMLEGGSEIWLASNESWVSKGQHKGSALKDAFKMTQDNSTGDTISSEGDKWWHKFGHSRRGLEHVVSMDEGKQRQEQVKTAIRAVIEEQHRQRMYNREDPEKLRIVSLSHTSWARDLALASGASDADAVKSSFADDRRSREFYLLKMAHSNSVQAQRVPEFMQPVVNLKRPLPTLDAHTASQISYRRAQLQESQEPLHDHADSEGEETLAHRAAGFSAEDGEKMNMAAVLSGMGGVKSVKA